MKYPALPMAVTLCLAVLCSPSPGQQNSQSGRVRLSEPSELKIVVLSGQNAEHNTITRRGAQTVVEVRDDNDQTVANASVVFELPSSGAGGSFPNSSRRQQTLTNYSGQASTSGFVPNSQQGDFELRVRASVGKRKGWTVIPQVNTSKTAVASSKSRTKLWIVLGAAAAGGAAAALLAGSGSGGGGTSPSVANSISLTPGSVTVSGPR